VKKAPTETNGHPSHPATSVLEKTRSSNSETEANSTDDADPTSVEEEEERKTTPTTKAPYAGKEGENTAKSPQNTPTRSLPTNIARRTVQTGTKPSPRPNIKDQVDGKHPSDFIHRHKCANKKRKDSYTGETARRRTLRTEEHGGKDKNSWIYKHSSSTKHPRAEDAHFEVLATGCGNRRKRRLAGAMYIRDMKPALNIQKESYRLALFS